MEVKLAAVIVLYKEKLEATTSYLSLLKEANLPIFCYDNSPHPNEPSGIENLTYVSNPENPGVSTAYNAAWVWAKEHGISHLLLLDTDSKFPEKTIEQYLIYLEANPEKIIAPSVYSKQRRISPFYFKYGKSFYGDNIKYGDFTLGEMIAINSGTVVPLKVLEECKGFEQSLPLDWSDVYFMRKAGKLGFKAFHMDMRVEHGLSEHENQSTASVKYRFGLQLEAIKIVSNSMNEKFLMLFWACLKSVKLSFRHKTSWFISHFIKNTIV